MGTKLSKMTLSSIFKRPETIQYPAQTRFVPDGLKGHIAIDIESCIFCGICEKRCPAGAITVDKPATSWSIDPFRCVQCNSCVYECPEDSLTMEPSYTAVAVEKSVFSAVKAAPSAEEIAAKEAKEAEKAAKIKAALEAKAAREKGEA
ncbi:MAG: 4Fe-4S binding protein [Raoultibacter sp.]|jgi:ech hydrogenase subunit F